MSSSASCPVKPGDLLAEKYRVEQVLGVGGMGVVVAAEHVDLCEKVALKFLLDTATENPELCERFLREARAAVKIKSEHVVRVSDVGRMPTGAPYMVMEYLEGEDLSQTLEKGPLPIQDAVDYLIQGCEAMNVAHRHGIVHRDLKPANLFLTRRPDGSPIVKVLDFGISKVTGDAQSLSLTHTQALMGSPLYMSPEQMKSTKAVDARTDIWALGVILYEMLAGDVPFEGESFTQVLVKVMSEQPEPLVQRRPEVPEALAQIVDSCLAKDPAHRPQSVAELAVLLSPFASKRTVGLQNRFIQAMSNPPKGPGSAFAQTRIEPESTKTPASGASTGELVQGTSTAWAEPTQDQPLTIPKQGAVRLVLVGGGGLLATALSVLALRVFVGDASAPGAAVPASAQAPAPMEASVVSAQTETAKEAATGTGEEEAELEGQAEGNAGKSEPKQAAEQAVVSPQAKKAEAKAVQATAKPPAKKVVKPQARPKKRIVRRASKASTSKRRAAPTPAPRKTTATESTTTVRKRRALSIDFK